MPKRIVLAVVVVFTAMLGVYFMWVASRAGPFARFRALHCKIQVLQFTADSGAIGVGGWGESALWDIHPIAKRYSLNGSVLAISRTKSATIDDESSKGRFQNTVSIWDMNSGALVATLDHYPRTVCSLAFRPQTDILAAGTEGSRTEGGGVVLLWDTSTGRTKGTLQSDRGSIWSLAFSDDGQDLATGSEDDKVRVWDIKAGATRLSIGPHPGKVLGLAFSPNGRVLAICSAGKISFWQVDSGAKMASIVVDKGTDDLSAVVAFHPQRDVVATGSRENGSVKFWDTNTWEEIKELRPSKTGVGGVESIAFSPDGSTMAVAVNIGEIELWPLRNSLP